MLDKYRYSKENKQKIIDSMIIIVDTREQKNEHITKVFEKYNFPFIRKKLDYGDYSFYIPKNPELGIFEDLYFDHDVVIERKASIEELSQNFTKLRQQFKNEMIQAPFNKVLLVENAHYSNIIRHNYETKYNEKLFLDTIHKFWIRYNCPFFFVNEMDSAVFIRHHFDAFLQEYLR